MCNLHKIRVFVTTDTDGKDGEANVIGESNCEDSANLHDEDRGRRKVENNLGATFMCF